MGGATRSKKPKINVATQNLRGLGGGESQDKLEDITREMDEAKIDVLIVTETWCESKDEGRLDSGHLLLTSGIGRRRGCRGTQGVGFLLSQKMASVYEESGRNFTGHGGRLATLRLPLQAHGSTHLYLIAAYAPVSNAGRQLQQTFHDDLDTLMGKAKQQEVMLVGGDFNAALGNETAQDGVCGPHGLSHTNLAGRTLRGTLTMHEMCSPVTFYKSQYKGSWMHMRSKRMHQLDHIFVGVKDRDRVRKCKYSHMLCDSDHFSVRLQLSLQLLKKRTKKTIRQQRTGKDFE